MRQAKDEKEAPLKFLPVSWSVQEKQYRMNRLVPLKINHLTYSTSTINGRSCMTRLEIILSMI
jgi:hypothetical protein